MSQSCHIGKLPNEILAKIAEFLSKNDLIECRLVNKHINAATTREFAKQYFASLPVHFSPYGLQTLVDICAHPELGARVRGISVSTLRIDRKAIKELNSHLEYLTEMIQHGLEEDDVEDEDVEDYPDAFDTAYDQLQSLIRTRDVEDTLEISGQATCLVTVALAILRRHGISVDVSVIGGEERGIGWEESRRSLDINLNRYSNDEHLNATVRILFNAICRSGCRVNSLQIYQDEATADVLEVLEGPIDLEYIIELPLRAFVDLKSLDLSFYMMPKQKALDSLDAILGQLCKLERLTLGLGCDPDNSKQHRVATEAAQTSGTLLHSLGSTRLKELKLDKMCISEKRLLSLLCANQNSLENLELRFVCLRHGSWDVVLSWVRGNMQLTRLNIYAPHDVNEDNHNALGYSATDWNGDKLGDRDLTFLGQEGVKSDLSKLLS